MYICNVDSGCGSSCLVDKEKGSSTMIACPYCETEMAEKDELEECGYEFLHAYRCPAVACRVILTNSTSGSNGLLFPYCERCNFVSIDKA